MTNKQADGEYYNKGTIIEWLKDQDIIKTSGQEKEARKQLSELPSAAIPSAEPKTGHWVGIDEEPHEVWECGHCGFVIDGSGCIEPYEYRDTYKYCPNCGCRMVEPQESEEV